MAYLYGDSTPFPLDVDFIEVLRDLVDGCVGILQIDEAVETILAQVQGEVVSAERGTAGLDTLAASVAATIETQKQRTESSFVGQIASRIMEETMQVLEAARRDAMSRGGMAQAEAQAKVAARRAKLEGLLERFLLKHELPDTQWGIVWTRASADGQVDAQAVATTAVGLEANFELALRPGHFWAGAVKVGDLRPGVAVSFPKRGRFSSEAKVKEERLDKWFVSEVNLAPGRALLIVRRALKPGQPGFEISLRDAGQARPTVRALDDASRPDDAVTPDAAEAAALEELWQAIELGLTPLVTERVRLLQASLEDVDVAAIETPAKIARALIESVAEIARELRRRSPVAAELSLKRQLEPGKREEIYVGVAELQEMIGAVGPVRRALFEPLGLSVPPPPPARVTDIFDGGPTQVTGRPAKMSRPR